MRIQFVLPFILCLFQICLSDNNRLKIKTRYGTYRGSVIKSRAGENILAFRGIPYAQPPVGKLRFKEPAELNESEDIVDANEDKICIQDRKGRDIKSRGEVKNNSKFIGNEDCLYLNIYVPKLNATEGLLPVYIWIHGGGFFAGSGAFGWHGPQYILERNRNMVIVTINYRLHVLGFLSANDENISGNLGLKDQTMALKWVRDNIMAFGGDPNSITLGGNSAGAASVHHHLNSKASKGMFHRAISQSGTADCSWAMKSTEEARDIASRIISFLGCPNEPNQLLSCLQELPVGSIMNSLDVLKIYNLSNIMNLAPVVEKDSPTAFMTKKSIEAGSKVPWLTGITNEEGIGFYLILAMDEPYLLNLLNLPNKYEEIFPAIAYYSHNDNADNISMALKDHYFGIDEFGPEKVVNLVKLLSDEMINRGFHKSTTSYKGPNFNYLFSYQGKVTSIFPTFKGLENGVSHSSEMVYLFKSNIAMPLNFDNKDLEFSQSMMDMWYNFIKTGDPTPDTHIWKESNGGKKYLDLTNDGNIMKSEMFKERTEFWNEIEAMHH